jgi:hypothetical protein
MLGKLLSRPQIFSSTIVETVKFRHRPTVEDKTTQIKKKKKENTGHPKHPITNIDRTKFKEEHFHLNNTPDLIFLFIKMRYGVFSNFMLYLSYIFM